MMAVWHGHYTAAETLLKMGNALVDAENEVAIFPLSPVLTTVPSQSGRTGLCLAAVKHPQLVKLCVTHGANVNHQDSEVCNNQNSKCTSHATRAVIFEGLNFHGLGS